MFFNFACKFLTSFFVTDGEDVSKRTIPQRVENLVLLLKFVFCRFLLWYQRHLLGVIYYLYWYSMEWKKSLKKYL